VEKLDHSIKEPGKKKEEFAENEAVTVWMKKKKRKNNRRVKTQTKKGQNAGGGTFNPTNATMSITGKKRVAKEA